MTVTGIVAVGGLLALLLLAIVIGTADPDADRGVGYRLARLCRDVVRRLRARTYGPR
ncbi:MAG: hypothetical protein ACRDQ0_07280 [Pseudonocardia sp.]